MLKLCHQKPRGSTAAAWIRKRWRMENNTFRSVTFGGFAKQDVVDYIERTAREAAETQDQLRQENEALSQEVQALRARVGELERSEKELQEKNAALNKERESLVRDLEQERTARQDLEAAHTEADALREEAERLRPTHWRMHSSGSVWGLSSVRPESGRRIWKRVRSPGWKRRWPHSGPITRRWRRPLMQPPSM